MKKKIILISGPTATGKSSLAIKISELVGGEIINADSIQLYKDLTILTARPSLEKEKIKHHLYGVLDAEISWSVGRWVNEVKALTEEIIQNNKTPIIVGGTGFYFKAITDGLSPIPDINPSIREELNGDVLKNGLESVYKDLQLADPDASKKINPNDKQRIVRALEVFKGTKRKISDYWLLKREKHIENPTINFKIEADREWIYNNCDLRVEEMFREGVVEEVERLGKKKYPLKTPIMKAIGVEEILSFLKGDISINKASDLIKFKTHQYAKRQITWINNQMITWNDINTQYSDKIIDKIIKKL